MRASCGDYIITMIYSPLQQNETDVYEDVEHIIQSRETLWEMLVQSFPEAARSTETWSRSASRILSLICNILKSVRRIYITV